MHLTALEKCGHDGTVSDVRAQQALVEAIINSSIAHGLVGAERLSESVFANQ